MRIDILFGNAGTAGVVEVRDGRLAGLRSEPGTVGGEGRFALSAAGRIEAEIAGTKCGPGARPTIVFVRNREHSFAFNLRDVSAGNPIWIPEFRAAVVPGDDRRDYAAVAADIAGRGLLSDFDRFKLEPEESYAHAASLNRSEVCPTWLGIGRDIRMFRVHFQELFPYWGVVQPFFHDRPQSMPDMDFAASHYELAFVIGQGSSCRPRLSRGIEDGVLPILQSIQAEQDLEYRLTAFATLETAPLRPGAVRGTDWRVAYARCAGCMLSQAEEEAMAELIRAETWGREQEVVACLRVAAVNTGRVPRHAWLRAAKARPCRCGSERKCGDNQFFSHGLSIFERQNRVFAVHRLNGELLPDEEVAVLVQPGGTATFDLLLPHSPLPLDRAEALMQLDVAAHHQGCRDYWNARLQKAASIRVPEKPIDDSIRAGLLHCDLICHGIEPDAPVSPTIGPYAPIGTESSPIIQYYDSVGWHKLAERCLDFFFERQRADGVIQNLANYQSETGPLLWTAGEHYRYTQDRTWLDRVTPNLKRAADYLLDWRRQHQTAENRAKGCYGMVSGKVADPDDFYHSFFLNAGTYIGLKRAAEMLRDSAPEHAARLELELPEYRNEIRTGLAQAQANAPVVPTGDGSWAPLLPPWTEYTGGISLYADGGNWFSHGAFASRSCLTGPLWLIIGEVVDPHEEAADFLLKSNQYPVTLDNAALSQPYYCRHDYAHLRRGEVEAFLKLYYNQLTALQDRETRTFWEHYFHAGQHKTHEEAWFLMQTRWMLYLEQGAELRLCQGIPRDWLAPGREIRVEGVKSYFGELAFRIAAAASGDRITATVEQRSGLPPKHLSVRLPEPGRRTAVSCRGGVYLAASESVVVAPFSGRAEVELVFARRS